ncbi:hypothetical protein [Burkholderia cenocepacia]|uniref:hypothetical protein n=1 Tax=Burkholderia cenocepacia TaxID=95486 RepID=UPI0002F23B7E|nr:hypothetical protein [Burkholderia cenocepacia]HEM7883543.1 hypothetical protein [Burkholderia cenocepacia]
MLGWSFPPNADGEDDDLNNPGIESFKNTPLTSLAREICQNSLDARHPQALAPVEVHFSIVELPAGDFPEIVDFRDILARCKAVKPDSKKFQQFFTKAEEVANQETIPCLLISDFHTTGLTGADGAKGTDWYKLTRTVGSSDKSGGLGSFGIGKFAPYANSDLRTVFYCTLNTEGQHAFQGVARLVTHTSAENIETRGTGYFGVREKNRPILNRSQIPPFLVRKDVGTNILIAGFKCSDQWEQEIIRAVIDSFFYAVWDGKLVVRAGGTTINNGSLLSIAEEFNKDPKQPSLTSAYLEALTSSDAREFIENDFEGYGRISLKIISGKGYPKRVAMVRGSGMKIFDKGHFLTPLRFAGVFNAIGPKIDSFLKSLEPPQHDSFEHERADSPAEAKARLRRLYDWIRAQVRSVAEADVEEETEIEGVSKYLPDDVDDAPKKKQAEPTDECDEAAEDISFVVRPREAFKERTTAAVESAEAEGDDAVGEDDDEPSDGQKGNGRDSDVARGDDAPSGEEGDGGGAAGESESSAPVYVPVQLKSQRVFSSDAATGSYVITFEPEIGGNGTLFLNAIGEVGQEKVLISQARLVDTNMQIPIMGVGQIGPFSMRAGQKMRIEVKLSGAERCALGVAVHAN